MKRYQIILSLWILSQGFPTFGQNIEIRISVKYVLDFNGSPPTGLLSDTNHLRRAIDVANAGNRRMGRGFRYRYPDFDGNVSGFSQYYNLHNGEEPAFEHAVRTNPQQSRWRADALNVYVVNQNLGTPANPACAGWASNPEDPISSTPPYNSLNGRVVVFCVDMQPDAAPFGIVSHEFGHHMGLIHTWADDRVADTPFDADPTVCEQSGVPDWCSCKFSNTLAKAAAEGWSSALINVMTNNIMSYHCDVDDDFDLTEGQLDRWSDITRRYLASEMTGVTYFADRNSNFPFPDGYSRSYSTIPPGIPVGGPYATVEACVNAASAVAGNTALIRPGNYNERLTINKPVTLRAPRTGWVTIGQ